MQNQRFQNIKEYTNVSFEVTNENETNIFRKDFLSVLTDFGVKILAFQAVISRVTFQNFSLKLCNKTRKYNN